MSPRLILLASALLASLAAAQAATSQGTSPQGTTPQGAPGSMANTPQGRPAATPGSPQDLVNRFAAEPWRFSGNSASLASLGQSVSWQGQKPARLLIGLNPNGGAPGASQSISGEIIALDAASRPLAAAPLHGHFTAPPGGDSAIPCVLKAETPHPITLTGYCGSRQLSGAFAPDEADLPLVFIAPGILDNPGQGTTGAYWLTAWRG